MITWLSKSCSQRSVACTFDTGCMNKTIKEMLNHLLIKRLIYESEFSFQKILLISRDICTVESRGLSRHQDIK